MCQMVITPEYPKYEAKWVHGQRGKGDTPKQIGDIKTNTKQIKIRNRQKASRLRRGGLDTAAGMGCE